MQVYTYEAVMGDGRKVEGEIAADAVDSVEDALQRQGLTLVKCGARRTNRFEFGRGKSSDDELIEFTRNMASLLEAGVPLLQVLEDLQAQAENKFWQKLLAGLKLRIEGGTSVSMAMADHPRTFNDIYVYLIQAGEESGNLVQVFNELAKYLEWSKQIKSEVRKALSYPATVMSALAIFICVLTFFVFPRMGGLFDSMQIDLPLPTRIMLGIGTFGKTGWPYLLAGGIAFAAAFHQFRRRPVGREFIDNLALRFPLVGEITRMAAFSRLASTLKTLLNAGVPLDRSLDLAHRGVGNRVIARAIAYSREEIHGGATFTEALMRSGSVPSVFIRMVKVGESTGDIPGMLARLTEHYEREMPHRVQKVTSAIGPITVIILAAVVGLAALAVFMPMLEIAGAIN